MCISLYFVCDNMRTLILINMQSKNVTIPLGVLGSLYYIISGLPCPLFNFKKFYIHIDKLYEKLKFINNYCTVFNNYIIKVI